MNAINYSGALTLGPLRTWWRVGNTHCTHVLSLSWQSANEQRARPLITYIGTHEPAVDFIQCLMLLLYFAFWWWKMEVNGSFCANTYNTIFWPTNSLKGKHKVKRAPTCIYSREQFFCLALRSLCSVKLFSTGLGLNLVDDHIPMVMTGFVKIGTLILIWGHQISTWHDFSSKRAIKKYRHNWLFL